MADNKQARGGKCSLSVRVRRGAEDLRNIRKTTSHETIRIQCQCPHVHEDGSPALFHTKSETSEITRNPMFCCRNCGKYIDIAPITEDELASALDTVDRMIDVVKIRMAPRDNSPENDQKLYKRLVKTQRFLKITFPDMAAAARKKNNKKRGGNGDGGGFTYRSGRS